MFKREWRGLREAPEAPYWSSWVLAGQLSFALCPLLFGRKHASRAGSVWAVMVSGTPGKCRDAVGLPPSAHNLAPGPRSCRSVYPAKRQFVSVAERGFERCCRPDRFLRDQVVDVLNCSVRADSAAELLSISLVGIETETAPVDRFSTLTEGFVGRTPPG